MKQSLIILFSNQYPIALNEIRELSQINLDRSGTIDPDELAVLRDKSIHLTFDDRMMEALSTHPNMLKRIKHLSECQV